MSSEPAKGIFERSVWEKAQSLSVAGILSIPVIFATIPAILFKVAAERQDDAADAFRAFAFAYVAFPLGYLLLRGLRVRVVVRVAVALLVAALALKLPAPGALLAALLVLVGVAAAWVGMETMRGRPSRVLAQGQGVWRSRRRWRRRDWWWATAPLIPLLLLGMVLVAGAVLVSFAERDSKGYKTLFASSRDIVVLDVALGTPDGKPGRPDSSRVRYAAVTDSAEWAHLYQDIRCATTDYAAAVNSLIDSTRLSESEPSRHSAPAAQRGAPGCPPREAQDTAGEALDSLGTRVHGAWVRLDSLIGHAATALDPLSQRVDSIQVAASKQFPKTGPLPDIAALDQDADRFRKLLLLRSTLNEARAVETREARQNADSVRQMLGAHQEGRLRNARGELAESYDRIRRAYIRLFAAAMALLAAGLWIARSWRPWPRRQPARVAAVPSGTSPPLDAGAEPPSRERVLADTYLLGLALVLVLGLPLLPKLDPANLDPRHPGRMFVQPGWYLPSFIAQQAAPIREPPSVQPGPPRVVYINRPTEPPEDSVPGVEPPEDSVRDEGTSPLPPGDKVPWDGVLDRLDSVLSIMRQIESRPTTVVVAPPARTPVPDTMLRPLLRDLKREVDVISRQVRTRPSSP
jgi:hypothetical protein